MQITAPAAFLNQTPRPRIVQYRNKRYSVRLEPIYWQTLEVLADRQRMRLGRFVAALAENYEGLMARRAKYTPLKRCCTEEDVADSMLSLILHNRFVTGEIIIVDGGFSSTT